MAVGFLTRIPIMGTVKGTVLSENCPHIEEGEHCPQERDLAGSMVYFPVVGLVLGLILALINAALAPILPSGAVNLALVLALTALTGAIHLDGLADTADGLCSKARDKEGILNIMKDPRIGAMGVIAIVMSILFKYELLSAVPSHFKASSLILMCTISRWAQVLAASFSKYARKEGGIGMYFIGKVRKNVLYLAAFFAAAISMAAWFPFGFFVLLAGSLFAWLVIKYINKRIGGMTGDTVGAVNELTEIAVLTTLCILIP
jgi:adenosylcobinamide-GDP ribazoletransferase